MDAVLAFVGSFFTSLWGFIKLGLSGLFSVISAFVYMLLDGLLTVVTLFVSSLDLSALVFTQYAQWANLPSQAIYLVNQMALPQCASLIAGAMLVRLLLNLIPAAVTRV